MEGQSPEFQLDGVAVPKEIGAAAAWWGVARKTLSRWCAAGNSAKDPCPYREPGLMLEWYGRVFSKPVPEVVAERIAGIQPAGAAPEAATRPALDMSQFAAADYSFATMLDSMRTLALAHKHLLNEALKNPDDTAAIRRAKEDLNDSVEQLRKLEKDSGKILREQGATLRRDDVRAALVDAAQRIPARLKMELKRLLRSVPAGDEGALAEWADRAVDSACAALVNTDLAA